MGKRDPHVNVVRATIAVAAAAFGGADAVTVLPFTLPLGLPDRFARRIARNTQLVLIEEANLARVADPAAGAGGIEALTEQLCRAGWGLFQEIERLGGAWAALERGLIQRRVAAVRAEHERAVARRSEVLTGSSDFPDLGELPASVLQAAAPPVSSAAGEVELEPLRPLRLAEPFERLRDLSDEELARAGARPQAFLANLGKPSDFTGRATFAKNFFESGGIETATNDGFESHDELTAAFRRSQARLACLCSSEELYARAAAEAAVALKSAGASHIYLVGRPGEEATRLRQAGVQTFIHAGCDALATLTSAHAMLRNRTERRR
jgi:methylmalonyl-CoA mutase